VSAYIVVSDVRNSEAADRETVRALKADLPFVIRPMTCSLVGTSWMICQHFGQFVMLENTNLIRDPAGEGDPITKLDTHTLAAEEVFQCVNALNGLNCSPWS